MNKKTKEVHVIKNKSISMLKGITHAFALAAIFTSCAKDRDYDTVYKKPELMGKASLNISEDFLYVPTSQGVPRFTEGMAPFVQGNERIIKFKFEEDGIVAYEMEQNSTFQDNTLNNKPVLKIPVEYKEYRCSENLDGECTNAEEENTEVTWDKKKNFIPDFEGVKVYEADSVGLPDKNDACFSEQGTKLVDYKVTDTDVSFELEKTYKFNDASASCVNNLWYSSGGWEEFAEKLNDNGAFNSRVYFSFAKLSSIATPKYMPIEYPVEDHDKFGFFKTSDRVKNAAGQTERTYKVNRWAPKDGIVNYHLSDEFAKPENKYLKDATYFAFDRINKVLERDGVKLRLKLNEPSGKNVGNLRNTMIVLVEDIASNLLGYGPTVANPRTGEIVKGHTNMYKGSLEKFAPYTYDELVHLEAELRKEEIRNALSQEERISRTGNKAASQEEQSAQELSKIGNKARVEVITNEITKFNTSNIASTRKLQVGKQPKISELKRIRDTKIKKDLTMKLVEKFAKAKAHNHEDHKMIEDELMRAKAHEVMHRNSVYTTDMFNFQSLGKASVDSLNKVDGIRDSKGHLIPWMGLTEEKQREVVQVLARHAYIPTLVHEIGHNLGLRHNFAGSTDKANFYTAEERKELEIEGGSVYSSIMDYAYSSLNELSTLGKYDTAALRFAYNREVELADGSMLPLEVMTDAGTVKQLTLSGLPLKNYEFCTDDNAGASLTCNRFDEGINELEIMNHYVEKYKQSYLNRYTRNRRKNMNDRGNWRHYVNTFYTMLDVRNIHETWQSYHTYLSQFQGFENLAIDGCTAEQRASIGEFCDTIGMIKDANDVAGRFYLDIIKTPDLTCDMSLQASVNGQIFINERLPMLMSEFIDDLNVELPEGKGYTKPTSCFEKKEEIVQIVNSRFGPTITNICIQNFGEQACQNLQVATQMVGEAGKLHNDVSAAYRKGVKTYTGDIEIRGNWIDKSAAMETLVSKELMTNAGASNHYSFADHPKFKAEITNLMEHLAFGKTLENPAMFKTEEGIEYSSQVAGDLHIATKVPRRQRPLNIFVEFPDSEDFNMATVLLKTAANYSIEYKSDAETVEDYVTRTAFRKSITAHKHGTNYNDDAFGARITEQTEIADYIIGAAEENTIATELIKRVKGLTAKNAGDIEAIVSLVDEENAKKVAAAKVIVAETQEEAQDEVETEDEVVTQEEETEPQVQLESGKLMLERVAGTKQLYANNKADVDALTTIVTTATSMEDFQTRLAKLKSEIGEIRYSITTQVYGMINKEGKTELETMLEAYDLYDLNYAIADEAGRAEIAKKEKNSLFNMPKN